MIAKRLITPAFDIVVSSLQGGAFPDPNQATLADLLADPIVQMVMNADRVTERQLMELIGGTLSKLAAGSQTAGGNPELRGPQSVGIMLLNRNNNVFVGRRYNTEGKPWQMPQGGVDEGEEPLGVMRTSTSGLTIPNSPIGSGSASNSFPTLLFRSSEI